MPRNEIRSSQGIVPFGVGAMVDFVDDTLMMAGLDAWLVAQDSAPEELKDAAQVIDDRLAQRLSAEMGKTIRYFFSLAIAPEFVGRGRPQQNDRAEMPFVRFPNWYYCPHCRHMEEIPWNTPSRDSRLRCNNSGRLRPGKGDTCAKLQVYRRKKMIPVRFVVACEAGHISDFPWVDWVHRGQNCSEGRPDLYFTSTVLPGVAGVRVECKACDVHRTLTGAFRREKLAEVMPEGCPGHRPWLGPGGQEHCSVDMQTIQRGASNAYFAKVAKSILIPPHSKRLNQILAKKQVRGLLEPLMPDPPPSTIEFFATKYGLDADEFLAAAKAIFGRVSGGDGHHASTETAYRQSEYVAFTGPRPDPNERHDFDLKPVDMESYGEWMARHFDAVALVSRLRETRVLQGFTRLVPPGPNLNEISALSLGKHKWLPGVSVCGEGIFLKFRRDRLDEWSNSSGVADRVEALRRSFLGLDARARRFEQEPSATMVMIHSFSHVLIRQLAYDSGYDASSIQERLYVSDDPDGMAGLLLYTASGDSEGTLGGLVRRGRPEYLGSTMKAALENARYCSSDPLCIESSGQGLNSLNLAACHACSLLPETSCEMSNMLLDRTLLIGLPGDAEPAYFEV